MAQDTNKDEAQRPTDEEVENQRTMAKGGSVGAGGGGVFPNVGDVPSIRDAAHTTTPEEPLGIRTADEREPLPANSEPRYSTDDPSDESATRGQERDRTADYTPPEEQKATYTYPDEEGHIVDPRVAEERQNARLREQEQQALAAKQKSEARKGAQAYKSSKK